MGGTPLSGGRSLPPLALAHAGCLLAALPWALAEVLPSVLVENQLLSPQRPCSVSTLGLTRLCGAPPVGGALRVQFLSPRAFLSWKRLVPAVRSPFPEQAPMFRMRSQGTMEVGALER